MSTAVTEQTDKPVMRPLRVLVPLIKEDLKHGDEAARNAGLPYYRAAGEKMLEAKGQMQHSEFMNWVKRNFDIELRAARLYMQLANATAGKQKGIAIPLSDDMTFQEAVRQHTSNVNFGKPAAWRGEVDSKVKQAQEQAKRLQDEELTRAQEREAERKLALQLIDIGFKALASKLHPDKGGSRDAMTRLNRVRDRLKAHA